MEHTDNPIKRAVALIGGQSATARALDITPPTVSQWVKGERRVPDRHCIAIDRLTNGQVRCEELRPDIDWSYLRGQKKRRLQTEGA